MILQYDGYVMALVRDLFYNSAIRHRRPYGRGIVIFDSEQQALNTELPAYSQIARYKIYHEEFEKTPKKSIKRFLYQEVR